MHYVYLLSHTYFPGYKIGITYNVEKRMKELDRRNSAGSFILIAKFEFENMQQAFNVEQYVLAICSFNLLENSTEMISNKVHPELLMRLIWSRKSEYKKGETPEKKSKEKWLDNYNKDVSYSNSATKNRNDDDDFKNNAQICLENNVPLSTMLSESS